MSILTSILLIVAGLSLLVIALRARPRSRMRRLEEWEERKLAIAANICHAAARDAFAIELDGKAASVDVLDHLIEQGWTQPSPALASHASESESVPVDDEAGRTDALPDEQFVLGAYLGQTIVEDLKGEWRVDAMYHRWPYVYFTRADLAVSPFELIQKKFEQTHDFLLSDALHRLETDLELRTNVRATTWHNAGTTGVTFGDREVASENDATEHD